MKNSYKFVFITEGGTSLFEVSDFNVDVAETRLCNWLLQVKPDGGAFQLFKNNKLIQTGLVKTPNRVSE